MIFLATFHKFLQFCLSNSVVSTTFGHFSQKSPLCRCGSYTHGSQRLMVSTEIIKNWGGAKWGGQKIILGGICPPPLAPPLLTEQHFYDWYSHIPFIWRVTHAKDLGPQHSAFVARVVLCISLNY